MCRTAPLPPRSCQSPPPPIKSTIAARLFRSIAFLVVSVWCAALALGGPAALAQGLPPPPPPPPAPTPLDRLSGAQPGRDQRLSRPIPRSLGEWSTRSSSPSPASPISPAPGVRWFAPNDKIGIKISAAGGELFTTHRDIVNAIVDGLVAAGHSRATSSSGTDRSAESRKPVTPRAKVTS